MSVDADTYAGFEVGVVVELIHHVERDGAVCEKHLAGLQVDAGGIGLKACTTGEGLGDHHAQKGGDVAFATGGDAFGVEFGEGVAAGVLDGAEEVEAAEGEGAEVVGFDEDL